MTSRWDRSRRRSNRHGILDRARSPEARERLVEHNRRIYIPLLLSALLPIVVAASRSAD